MADRAALAAALMAFSAWQLYWSQNARFYTLAQCFGLVGVGLLVRGIRDVRVAGLVAAGVFLLLGAATHPSAAMLMGAALFAPVLLARFGKLRVPPGVRLGRPLAIVFVVALVASVPWMRDVWHVWSRRQGVGDPVHLVLTTGYLLTPVVGLGVLIGALKRVRLLDGDLQLVVTEARVRRVLELCDLDRVFTLHADVTAAVS